MKFLLAMFAVGGFLVLNWAEREPHEPPSPPYPDQVIQIGTNPLPIGTHLFATATRTYRGQVRAVEQDHRFPGGEVAPGVLVGRDSMRLWVRRENLRGTVIESSLD